MNYLSHGHRFLHAPLFLAGTAVPDWLSVVNRRIRVRRKLVEPFLEANESPQFETLATGMLQHHIDDEAFHTCAPFLQAEGKLSSEFRRFMPDRYDHRPAFLGHIVTELLIDAHLAKANPGLLDEYYATVASVDAKLVEACVNQIATKSTDRLAWFIGRFLSERFLYDYSTDSGLMLRLNQVLTRVRLPQMQDECLSAVGACREIISGCWQEMLETVKEKSPPLA